MNDKRLMRTKALLGENGVKNLQNATVMLFGLGAVGGYALEGLARAGIGHLILVDFSKSIICLKRLINYDNFISI